MISLNLQQFFFQLLPFSLYLLFLILDWGDLSFQQKKICCIINLVFLLRIDNCLSLVSIVKKEIQYEFELTVLMILVYFVNIDNLNDFGNENSAIGVFSQILFLTILGLNIIIYALAFLLLILFLGIIIFMFLKGT